MPSIAQKAPKISSPQVMAKGGLVSTCVPFLLSSHVPTAPAGESSAATQAFLLTQHSCRRSVRYNTAAQNNTTPKKKKKHGHSPEAKQCGSQLAASVFVIPKVTPILAAQCEEIPQIPRRPYLFIRGGSGTLSGAAAPRRSSSSSPQLPRARVWSPHSARRAPHAVCVHRDIALTRQRV